MDEERARLTSVPHQIHQIEPDWKSQLPLQASKLVEERPFTFYTVYISTITRCRGAAAIAEHP